MKITEFVARAKRELTNVATHHDTPVELVDHQLLELATYIGDLRNGLAASSKAYAEMRAKEQQTARVLRNKRAASKGKK